jgi:hypothetical protein
MRTVAGHVAMVHRGCLAAANVSRQRLATKDTWKGCGRAGSRRCSPAPPCTPTLSCSCSACCLSSPSRSRLRPNGGELLGAVLDAVDNERAARRPYRRPWPDPHGPSGETVLDVLSTLDPARCWWNLCEPAGRPAAGVPTPGSGRKRRASPSKLSVRHQLHSRRDWRCSAAAISPGRPVATVVAVRPASLCDWSALGPATPAPGRSTTGSASSG